MSDDTLATVTTRPRLRHKKCPLLSQTLVKSVKGTIKVKKKRLSSLLMVIFRNTLPCSNIVTSACTLELPVYILYISNLDWAS